MVWLHAVHCPYNNVLIYSPDNDVYHIGLPLLQKYPQKHFIVQVKAADYDSKFLDLNKFVSLLQKHQDLSDVPENSLASILQVLFVVTGCDYVSYFKHHTKNSFYGTFFEFATFITGQSQSGRLDHTTDQNWQKGCEAFFRLIGCEFFKTHSALFAKMVEDRKPTSLFTSEDGISSWLSTIRKTLISGTASEDYYLPSDDSLKLHWMRTCAVVNIWQQASKHNILLPPYDKWGFGRDQDNKIIIKWDSDLNFRRTDIIVQLWTKGCSCKTGCQGRCGCRRGGKPCGPACACKANCLNAPDDPSVTSMLDIRLRGAQDSACEVPEVGAEVELTEDPDVLNSDDDISDTDTDYSDKE